MSEPVTIGQFACICGARDEGNGDPPACWDCGRQMRQWSTRTVSFFSSVLSGEKADGRTDNGGY